MFSLINSRPPMITDLIALHYSQRMINLNLNLLSLQQSILTVKDMPFSCGYVDQISNHAASLNPSILLSQTTRTLIPFVQGSDSHAKIPISNPNSISSGSVVSPHSLDIPTILSSSQEPKELDESKTSQPKSKSSCHRCKRPRRAADKILRHFRCPVMNCDKSYGSEGSLYQHIKIKHPSCNIKSITDIYEMMKQNKKTTKMTKMENSQTAECSSFSLEESIHEVKDLPTTTSEFGLSDLLLHNIANTAESGTQSEAEQWMC